MDVDAVGAPRSGAGGCVGVQSNAGAVRRAGDDGDSGARVGVVVAMGDADGDAVEVRTRDAVGVDEGLSVDGTGAGAGDEAD